MNLQNNTASSMEVSNGKALDLLFGPNSNHYQKVFPSSVHQYENFRSPPPPPYHFHTHASSSSQQGTHQLGWKGGSGQACGHMMRAPKSNNGESATTTDVLTGLYKTSDATLYNHQYHDNNQYVATNYTSMVMGTTNSTFDHKRNCTTSSPFINYSGVATCVSSSWNVCHSSNNAEQHTLAPSTINNNFAHSSVFKQEHYQEQYNTNKQPVIDRVAPMYCHDSVVVARPQNSVSNAFALPPQTNNMINHHNQYQQLYNVAADVPTTTQQQKTLDICYHDENTNLDNCKCHLRIIRPTHMLANIEDQQHSYLVEPHAKKMKFDSVVETHSSSSSNASNSISESTASRKNSLDGVKQTSTETSPVVSAARKPIVSKKSNTKKPKSDDNSQTKKKVTTATKKASPTPKAPVKFNVDLSKENLQDTATIPIRILAYNLGLTKDIQKSWRYRDIRRALFERMIDEHIDFVDNQLEHSLLRERLPHKLTYSNFCKRVMLLVFHFVVRDGKEPKFFRRPLVQRDYIEKLLKDNDPHFYSLVETCHAHQLHNLMNRDGKTFQEAITIVFKDLIDPTTLQSLHGSFNPEASGRKIRKPRSQKKSCSDDEDDDEISEDEDLEEKPAARSRRRASTDLKRKHKPVSDDSDDEDDY